MNNGIKVSFRSQNGMEIILLPVATLCSKSEIKAIDISLKKMLPK
jgi:hypothetical protein